MLSQLDVTHLRYPSSCCYNLYPAYQSHKFPNYRRGRHDICMINIVKNHLQLQSSSYRYDTDTYMYQGGRISNIIRVDSMSNTEETRNPISEHTASTTLLESLPKKPDFSKDEDWGWGRNKCNDLLIKGECSCFPSNKIGCTCYLCGKLIVPDDCINDLSTYTHTSCVNKQ